MSFDYAGFKPGDKSEFFKGLANAVSTEVSEFWSDFSESSEGHLRALTEGVLQTQIDVELGVISKETARKLAQIHQLAWRNFVLSLELIPYRIAQGAIDAVAKGVAWAFYNLTGLNIAPSLVPK